MSDELYNKIDKFCNKTDWGKYPTYEHALENFIKGIVEEETKELQKENAELKKEWQEQVQKATDEGYARTLQTIQLTKAKELLKNILAISVHDKRQCTYDAYILTVKEAEQFLNSEVEK